MKILIIPTYKELFDGSPPELTSLIAGIPSKLIVSIISVMNGELYLNQNKFKSQVRIFNFLLRRQSSETKKELRNKVTNLYASKGLENFTIFSTYLNIHFLHLSLIQYYDDDSIVDTTPEQELNIFKAYFVASSSVFNDEKIEMETDSRLDFFRKNTWPMMINQFLLNHPYNYFLGMVKSKCFFDALEFEAGLKEYVKSFVGRFEDSNSLSYIFRFGNTLQQSLRREDTQKFEPFSIRTDSYSIPFFDELSLNLKTYSTDYSENKFIEVSS